MKSHIKDQVGFFSSISLSPSFITLYFVSSILNLTVFYTWAIASFTPKAESLQAVVDTCCKQNKLLVRTPAHGT